MPAQDHLLDGQEQKSGATMCVVWAKDFKFYQLIVASSSKWLQVDMAWLLYGQTDGRPWTLWAARAVPPFTIRRDGAPIVFYGPVCCKFAHVTGYI